MDVHFRDALAYAASVNQSAVARRQPIFNIPRIVVVAIVLMGAIHAGRSLLSDQSDATVLARFAFVPGRLTASVDPAAVAGRLDAMAQADSEQGSAAAAWFFLGSGSPQPWTAFTYALLHGSWTHFVLNAVWLLAFGAPVARRLGPWRFLALFGAGTLAGAAAHYAVDPLSLEPLIGASAAVSACMGAALRFMFQSGAAADAAPRPPTHGPRVPIRAMLRDRRAAAFLLVWMVSNFVTGVAAVPLGLSDMPIAWQAHVGGFLFGLLAFPLFDPVRAEPTDGGHGDSDDAVAPSDL